MISVEVMDRIKTFILPNYEKIYAKEMLFFAKEFERNVIAVLHILIQEQDFLMYLHKICLQMHLMY